MRKEKYKEKIITHIPTRENHLTKMLGLCVAFLKKFCRVCVCVCCVCVCVCVFASGDPVACTNCYLQTGGVVTVPRQKTWKELFTDVCLWEVSDSFLILKNLSDSLFNMGFFD